MRTLISFLLVFAGLVILTSFNTEKKISLVLNLKKDADYLLHTDNQQKISSHVAEMSVEEKTHIVTDMDWTVRDKYGKDSTFIETAYDYMLINIDGASHQIKIDSKTGNSEPDKYFSHLITLMHHHPVTVETNARGAVLAIRGLDELRHAVHDSLFGGAGAGEVVSNKLLSEDALKTAFSIISIYPSGPVAPGDSWENDVLVNSMVSLKVHQKYTLKSFTSTTAVVAVSCSIESTKDTLTISGRTIPAHISGSRSGLYHIDRATGLLNDGRLNQDMTIKMTMMGQSFLVNTTGETQLAESLKKG